VQPQGQKRGAATLTEFLVATAAAAAAAAAAHNKVPVYEHLKDYISH
jgi:enolase